MCGAEVIKNYDHTAERRLDGGAVRVKEGKQGAKHIQKEEQGAGQRVEQDQETGKELEKEVNKEVEEKAGKKTGGQERATLQRGRDTQQQVGIQFVHSNSNLSLIILMQLLLLHSDDPVFFTALPLSYFRLQKV